MKLIGHRFSDKTILKLIYSLFQVTKHDQIWLFLKIQNKFF